MNGVLGWLGWEGGSWVRVKIKDFVKIWGWGGYEVWGGRVGVGVVV